MSNESNVQQPGQDIRTPNVTTEKVETLSRNLFGLKPLKIKQLDGYIDKNFHLIESTLDKSNPHITTVWPHGYVLKIMNSLEESWFIEAQNQLLLYVASHGMCVPEPVKNINGDYFSKEALKKDDGSISYHVTRLLKYHPGIVIKDYIESSLKLTSALSHADLFYNIGQNTATLDIILKEFKQDFSKRNSVWQLRNALEVKKYLFAIKAPEKLALVLKVLDAFEQSVVNKLGTLKTGLIHGDLNNTNLIVNRNEVDRYRLSVILDFNDVHTSAYMFELAIIMCYMLILTKKEIEIGKYILQGYNEINPLPVEEYKLLPITVCARLCQSLVIGIYTSTLDPLNEYIVLTQTAGWKLLNDLMSMDHNIINDLWLKNIEK